MKPNSISEPENHVARAWNAPARLPNLKFLKRLPDETGLLIILIGFGIILSILSPYFLTVGNFVNVIITMTSTGIVAVGMTFVMLSGGIDLSVGSTMALAATIAATYSKSGSPAVVVILIAVGIGIIIGLINGIAITKLRVPPLITTLAMLSVARGLELIYGRAVTVTGLGSDINFLGRGTIGPIPVPIVLLFGLYVIASIVLSRTSFGRKIYAVGGNERAAQIVGIKVNQIKISVYVISAVLSAFGGLILVARLGSAPTIIGTGLELDVIAAVVIGGTSLSGGKGGVWGTLLGVAILGLIQNTLNLLNVSPYYTQLVQGLVIFVAVAIDMNRRRGT
ncbi:MAG: ABC transporter permease [Anaerolineae bacterium]|nr:ABC transporter permease [Anaerolineae bacterium]